MSPESIKDLEREESINTILSGRVGKPTLPDATEGVVFSPLSF